MCIVLVLAAGAGLNKLGALFASRFHAFAPVDIEVFPDLFNAALPGAGFFLRALEWSIVFICGLGLAIYIIRLGWIKRAWWLWAGILLVLVGLGPASAHSVREFFAGWVMSFVPLAVAVAIVFWFFRNNLLAYLGAAFCLEVAQPLVSLFSQHAAFYRSNGLLLAVLALLFLAWLLLAGAESRGSERAMIKLNEIEVRVLGSLLEKEITTPDYYPLSLNALINACNQKSNRDPVMALDESAVMEALDSLNEKGWRATSSSADSRVPKYAHRLQEVFNFDRREMAVLCVLLLRGPQTPGELRGRRKGCTDSTTWQRWSPRFIT